MDNFKKQTFIITDDNIHFLNSMKFALNFCKDLECIGEAYNGEELLKLLEVKKPDLIFLDIDMPVMNGEKALVRIKAKNKNIKVIMLSMHHDTNITMKLMALGANSYLTKDTDIDVMLDTIRNLEDNGTTYFNAHVTKAFKQFNNIN